MHTNDIQFNRCGLNMCCYTVPQISICERKLVSWLTCVTHTGRLMVSVVIDMMALTPKPAPVQKTTERGSRREVLLDFTIPKQAHPPQPVQVTPALYFKTNWNLPGLLRNPETETMMVQELLPGRASSVGCITTWDTSKEVVPVRESHPWTLSFHILVETS